MISRSFLLRSKARLLQAGVQDTDEKEGPKEAEAGKIGLTMKPDGSILTLRLCLSFPCREISLRVEIAMVRPSFAPIELCNAFLADRQCCESCCNSCRKLVSLSSRFSPSATGSRMSLFVV